MAVAIPLVVAGVSAYMQSRKSGSEQGLQGVAGQQSQLARTMQDIAGKQFTMSQPALAKAMSYYMTLAGGSKGSINQALAPQTAQLNDTYKGAEKAINAKAAPGAQRTEAIADLYRQKAGQLGLMPMQARSDAVQHLGDLGSTVNSQGMLAMGGSANALNSQAGTYGQLSYFDQQRRAGYQDIGNNLAKIYGPYLFGANKQKDSRKLDTKSLNQDFIGGSMMGGF